MLLHRVSTSRLAAGSALVAAGLVLLLSPLPGGESKALALSLAAL